MYLNFKGMNLRIFWNYQQLDRKTVRCCITKAKDDFFAIGQAECSSKDKFDKEKGRKLSLARALAAAGLTKSERICFWTAYFNRI